MDINNRIKEHNLGIHAKSFTKKATDWQLYFSIACESRSLAIRIEDHLKKMHSRTYLENLKKYPDISKRLIEKYGQ